MEQQRTQILVLDNNSFNLKKTLLTPETYKIHSHINFELNYIVSGWGTRIIGDNIESFVSGDLVLIGPDLPHCWEVKGVAQGAVPECITIHFHENFLGQKLVNSPELEPMYDLFKQSILGIQFFGEEVFDVSYVLNKMLNANALRKLIFLLEIFEILIRTNDRRVLARPGYVNDVNNSDNKRLKLVYEFLMVNFSKKIKLEEVAQLCCMSPSAFCRFFDRATGKTLFEYLKEVRIGYACKLFQNSGLNVSDICYQTGFNNLAHFNNQFKEICGLTPGQYKKNYKLIS